MSRFYHKYPMMSDCLSWLRDCGFDPNNLANVRVAKPKDFNGCQIITFIREDGLSKDYCFDESYSNIDYDMLSINVWRKYLDQGCAPGF